MNEYEPCFAGIDVGMAFLDVALYPQGAVTRFDNHAEGIAALLAWLCAHQPVKIVIEATGGLEYEASRALKDKGFAVAVVNPARTAAFRAMAGKIAKTDRLDARLLAEFAARMNPDEGGIPDEGQKRLKDLVARRRQLVALIVEERNRLPSATDHAVKSSLQAIIALLNAERIKIEAELVAQIEQDAVLAHRYKLLQTIPAIGPVVATTLVTEMPELGTMTPKEVASLSGLAPHNNDSGKRRGVRNIRGGRSCVRAALYMAAIVAMRHNPAMKETYLRLVANGKPKKLAIVVIMRKLVIVANQIVKQDRPWQHDYKMEKISN